MTFKEYVEENYSSIAETVENTGFYTELVSILFPSYMIVNQAGRLEDINYTPFKYENDATSAEWNGGKITLDLTQYICENYYEHNINERFFKKVYPYTSTLIRKIMFTMLRYKYKWHALYESMLLDSEYDPLDNVNEFYSESITRTPDLSYAETNNTNYGQKEKDDTNEYGQKEKTDTNEYGAKSTDTSSIHGKQRADTTVNYGRTNESRQETIGEREDEEKITYGSQTNSKHNTHSVYPFDSPSVDYPQEGDEGGETLGQHMDRKENSIGSQLNTSSKASSEHKDVSFTNVDAYSDSNTVNESDHSDSLKSIEKDYTDKLKTVEKSHKDSFNGLKTESGTEETAIEIRRHGNIGVTKSTTLIEDFRKIHYFDLIQIMGNDIINEIFDLNFES